MLDLHVHTSFSDGTDDAASMINRAEQIGLELLAITDHFDSWDKTLGNRSATDEDLMNHFSAIQNAARATRVKVLCGVETCTGADGRLRLSDRVVAACDIIITSPHYLDYEGQLIRGEWMNPGYWEAYKRLVLAMASGKGDVLGHPEAYLPFKPLLPDGTTFQDRMAISRQIADKYFDEPFIRRLGQKLSASGKAYEMHGMSNTPREWVVEVLRDLGVWFSVGSDAHTARNLGCNERAVALSKKYGLKIINLSV